MWDGPNFVSSSDISGSHYSSDTHHRRRHQHRYHHQKRNRNFPFSLLPFRSPNVSAHLLLRICDQKSLWFKTLDSLELLFRWGHFSLATIYRCDTLGCGRRHFSNWLRSSSTRTASTCHTMTVEHCRAPTSCPTTGALTTTGWDTCETSLSSPSPTVTGTILMFNRTMQ